MPFDGLLPATKINTKVNASNVVALAGLIASKRYGFSMFRSEPSCQSAGCILGHAKALWTDVHPTCGEGDLGAKLGLDSTQTQALCFAPVTVNGVRIPYYQVTRKMAVAVVLRLLTSEKIYFDTNDS